VFKGSLLLLFRFLYYWQIIMVELMMLTFQAMGEMSGDDGLGSQSYVPFSLPKDPDIADDTTKYVYVCHGSQLFMANLPKFCGLLF